MPALPRRRSRALLHQKDGPLTRSWCGSRAGSGSARCPRASPPTPPRPLICGFCSTGCGLRSTCETARRSTCRRRATTPVNLGMACPKGWEALTPLAAPDRATQPLLRNAAGKLGAGRLGRRRSTRSSTASRRSRPSTAPQSVAFLGTGQIADRGAGVARRAGQVRHGDGPRRRQHPPVHGHRGRRLQAGVRLRRPALHLRGLRGVGRDRARRLEPLHRPPDHVGARLPQPAQARDHRRRSAQDRDGDGGDAAPAAAPEVRSDALLRPRATADRARLDRPRVHRRAHQRLRGVRRARRAVHARGDRRGDRPDGGADREAAPHDPRGQARLVLVDDGRQPELRGRARWRRRSSTWR